jgi:bud site selection protein 20
VLAFGPSPIAISNADSPRRRLKELRDPAYTVAESERSAGLGVDNKQRGVEEVVRRMEGMAGVQEAAQ